MHFLPDAFAKNRSEEEDKPDNWLDFVAPPFINKVGIQQQRKALVIVGGRGSGKTTLLRYFCHDTRFSRDRNAIEDADLKHIGLYWRADTNFMNSFVGCGQSPETWRSVFEHVLACDLACEIIEALHNLNCSVARREKFGKLDQLSFRRLRAFGDEFCVGLAELHENLNDSRIKLSVWLNNIDTEPKPKLLPATSFLQRFIECLRGQLEYLEEATFAVFIDEYENLRDEQQRLINGLLKHGQSPLLFNVAMKRNGWSSQNTVGRESIERSSDFTIIDIEESLKKDFDLFMAELLFFRLAHEVAALRPFVPIEPDALQDVSQVEKRYRNEEYRDRVLGAASVVLPRVGPSEAASLILADDKLRSHLLRMIGSALKRRGVDLMATDFVLDGAPQASILMHALLNRDREDPFALRDELQKESTGENTRLSKGTDLRKNNLFACVHEVFRVAQRDSPLYSGFKAMALMSRCNVRHFLELVHEVFSCTGAHWAEGLPVIPYDIQAKAIRQASGSVLDQVKGHGKYGPQLYALVKALGSLFTVCHRDERQSEPEVNHFTIARGAATEKLLDYLKEAEKWSVLYLDGETKRKSPGFIGSDYVLNPIFSAHFQISYRKMRSVDMSTDQLMVMLEGDQADKDRLIGNFKRGGSVQDDLFGGS